LSKVEGNLKVREVVGYQIGAVFWTNFFHWVGVSLKMFGMYWISIGFFWVKAATENLSKRAEILPWENGIRGGNVFVRDSVWSSETEVKAIFVNDWISFD
jgi:hypothetical protein